MDIDINIESMRQIEEQIDTFLLDSWWSRRSIWISKTWIGKIVLWPAVVSGFQGQRKLCVPFGLLSAVDTCFFIVFYPFMSVVKSICWIQTYGQLWRKSLCIRWQIAFLNRLHINASIVWRYSGPRPIACVYSTLSSLLNVLILQSGLSISHLQVVHCLFYWY